MIYENAVAGLGFVLRIVDSKFANVSQRRDASFFEVAGQRFVYALRLDEFDQTQLHRVVAIYVFRPPLDYHARSCLQNRAGNRGTVVGEHLRHAKFYSEYAVDCHFVRSFLPPKKAVQVRSLATSVTCRCARVQKP
jgi:hypothetical protein